MLELYSIIVKIYKTKRGFKNKMSNMTPRERVMCALNHKEADKVPLDFGSTMETTISIKAYKQLKEYLHLCEDKPIRTKMLTAQFADVDPEISEFIGSDSRGVQPDIPDTFDVKFRDEKEYSYYVDEFGITWRKPIVDGLYYDMFKHPLSEAEELEDITPYKFPDMKEPSRYDKIGKRIDILREDGKYPIIFDNNFGNGIFQMCNHLMGYDVFLVLMALRDPAADYILDKVTEEKMELWDEILTRYGDKIDIAKELDDLGTQVSLFLSPDDYRHFIKPRLKKLVNFIKSKSPDIKMMMHSCGSIKPLIPDLIDCGIEILNPIQYTATNMDLLDLKKEFGKDITFWGGGIETQKIMPFGTVQEVKDEVKKNTEILMKDGGFVFAQVHSLQYGVPCENMMAMWDTAKEVGVYSK
jgi:uroporphyrinogen decarboxylase